MPGLADGTVDPGCTAAEAGASPLAAVTARRASNMMLRVSEMRPTGCDGDGICTTGQSMYSTCKAACNVPRKPHLMHAVLGEHHCKVPCNTCFCICSPVDFSMHAQRAAFVAVWSLLPAVTPYCFCWCWTALSICLLLHMRVWPLLTGSVGSITTDIKLHCSCCLHVAHWLLLQQRRDCLRRNSISRLKESSSIGS